MEISKTHSKLNFIKGTLILASCALALFFIYDYLAVFSLRPQSMHAWRQTDGASFALNYYLDNLKFFEPRLHSLDAEGGKTIAEFPLLYYLTAMLYKVFGIHEGIFRAVNFCFFLSGVFSLYAIAFLVTTDLWVSICIALFLFASPLQVYYAFNFLPDSTAMGFMLSGTVFLLLWHKKQVPWQLILSTFFFSIAGMIKIITIYPLLAYAGCVFIFLFTDRTFLKRGVILFFFTAIVIAFSLIWLMWTKHYKEVHHSSYFLQTIVPFALYNEHYNAHWYTVPGRLLRDFWWNFFPLATQVALAFFLFHLYKFRNSFSKQHLLFISLLFALVIAIFLLFYFQFMHHDYYAVILVPAAFSIFIAGAYAIIKSRNMKLIQYAKLILVVALLFSIASARMEVHQRYSNTAKLTGFPSDFFTITPYLRSIGVNQNALMLSPDDLSPNGTLYMMDNRGFSGYYLSNTASRYDSAVAKGARYLVCWKKETLSNPLIKQLSPDSIGTYGVIGVYRLSN
ncbi:MAG: hypothetical protein U0T74_02865 [Chitinophagales bacterium]